MLKFQMIVIHVGSAGLAFDALGKSSLILLLLLNVVIVIVVIHVGSAGLAFDAVGKSSLVPFKLR